MRLVHLLALVPLYAASAQNIPVAGVVDDPQGKPVPGATVRLNAPQHAATFVTTSSDGSFRMVADVPGRFTILIHAIGFPDVTQPVTVPEAGVTDLTIAFTKIAPKSDSVTVTADVKNADIQYPDPATKVYVRDQILDANPGRPGAPVSIPGYPIETASSGIKAPQYFAPGVAGDHGEPIATYLQIGTYLMPNNLSANAHGNGYSDPNVMIPQIIESVQVDGGAFNVREGNHSVNVADVYGFNQRLEPHVTLTGDYRDVDLSAGWSPLDQHVNEFFAAQVSYGNGFLQRLEHRQQYKFNAFRGFQIGKHEVSLMLLGYYGFSYIPGLVPVNEPNLRDSLDRRQRDQTHSASLALNDVWNATPSAQVQSSAFFRTYNLSLSSNFGDGLIRQSEFRTVAGGNETYVKRFSDKISLMAGVDYLRDAPRRLDLDHYQNERDASFYGPFEKVSANNLTLNFVTPYVALDGKLAPWLRYNLGWRRDEIDFNNHDLLHAGNSYQRWVGVNNPKATVSLMAPEKSWLPSASFSFGETYFSNDPRTGTGDQHGTPLSRAHSYQLIVFKQIAGIDFRTTFGRVTQEQSLAKIDADTGLQQDQGATRNNFVTVAARRYFTWGLLQGSVSKADARDLSDGSPLPEAPRLIVDFLGSVDRLPFHLHARAEYEQIGAKPLGGGFVSVPVKEFRGALVRPFLDGRLDAGINVLISRGYTGQTLEAVALQGENAAFEHVVGVALPSYVTASFTYHFRPRI